MMIHSGKNRWSMAAALFLSSFAYNSYPDQFESLTQSYNILSTIAGKGGEGDGVVNGWNVSFEGKPAVDAVLSSPHFAMADSSGNIYIADKDAHSIRKVDRAGIITTFAGINTAGDGSDGNAREQALSSPNGLWVSKAGALYILDLGNKKVRKVDTNGLMTTVFKDEDGFGGGRALWVSSTEDTIWYAGINSVKRWTAAGGITVCASGFSALGNINQDSRGYIVATDRSANLVYRIGPDTTKTVIAGTGLTSGGGDGVAAIQTSFYGVRGVWFLEDNSYFLATHEGSQVWFVDTSGIAHVFLDGKNGDKNHTGDGENFHTSGFKVSEVRAVTVDYQGNVLITENDKGYIRKVAKRNTGIFRAQNRELSKKNLNIRSFSQKLELSFSAPGSQRASVLLIDQAGRVVHPRIKYRILSNKMHTVEIEKESIITGIYLIRVKTEHEWYCGTACITK